MVTGGVWLPGLTVLYLDHARCDARHCLIWQWMFSMVDFSLAKFININVKYSSNCYSLHYYVYKEERHSYRMLDESNSPSQINMKYFFWWSILSFFDHNFILVNIYFHPLMSDEHILLFDEQFDDNYIFWWILLAKTYHSFVLRNLQFGR